MARPSSTIATHSRSRASFANAGGRAARAARVNLLLRLLPDWWGALRNDARSFSYLQNAGTSVDAVFARYFGTRWSTFEGSSAVDIVSTDRLRVFISQNPHLWAVSSHLARPPIPAAPDILPVLFLRDPIDRAASVYRYVAQDKTQPSSAIAASRSFRGYIEWALESEDGGNVVRNHQTIHLSEASFRYPHIHNAQAAEADFQQARHLLESWPAVAIVRRFADSIRWFDQAYGHPFPYLFIMEEHRNKTNCDFYIRRGRVASRQGRTGTPTLREVCRCQQL
jgi:hypothetical protein